MPTQKQPHHTFTLEKKGQHTVDIEHNSGSFSHWHRRVAGHTGEVAAAVSVDRCDGQVAPGRHPLSVWEHFLFGKEKRKERRGWLWVEFREGSRRRKIKEEEEERDGWGRTKRTKKGGIGKYHGRNRREEGEEKGERHRRVTNGAKRGKEIA